MQAFLPLQKVASIITTGLETRQHVVKYKFRMCIKSMEDEEEEV
jgi:hypothetical protein